MGLAWEGQWGHVTSEISKEPHDMNDQDGRRPDLQLLLPNQHYLVDVCVIHPLCPTHMDTAARKPLAAAHQAEMRKSHKYTQTAQMQHAEFVPFAVETMAGIAREDEKLLNHILSSCRQEMTLWPHEQVMAALGGSIAIAVCVSTFIYLRIKFLEEMLYLIYQLGQD